MLTSHPAWRSAFGAMDGEHGEEALLRQTHREMGWTWDLTSMLRDGGGLWLAGSSKLALPLDLAAHVALAADAGRLWALITCLASLLSSSLHPSRLHVHVLTLAAERVPVESALRCAGLLDAGATLSFVALDDGAGGAAGARFELATLLPSVEKAMWVDTDALLLADAATIVNSAFRREAGRAAIAVVRRPGRSIQAAFGLSSSALQGLGLAAVPPGADAFHTRTFIANLVQWRATSFGERLSELDAKLRASGHRLSGATDGQGALVLLAHSLGAAAVQGLPAAWSVDGHGGKRIGAAAFCTARMLHFSGRRKPGTDGQGLAPYCELLNATQERAARCSGRDDTRTVCGLR